MKIEIPYRFTYNVILIFSLVHVFSCKHPHWRSCRTETWVISYLLKIAFQIVFTREVIRYHLELVMVTRKEFVLYLSFSTSSQFRDIFPSFNPRCDWGYPRY